MHRRLIELAQDGLRKLRLRVKYQIGFAKLPALATHLVCFVGGTLLFEPDTRGKAPADLLVPWSLSRVVGGVQIAAEYHIVSEKRSCRLFEDSFRLWRPEEKRIFVILPKPRSWAEVVAALQNSDTRLHRKGEQTKPQCRKTSPHVTIFP